jgi:hypothetical protein
MARLLILIDKLLKTTGFSIEKVLHDYVFPALFFEKMSLIYNIQVRELCPHVCDKNP